MYFEPIAIIGEACVFPGALTPEKLWNNIYEGKDLLSRVPHGYWRTDPAYVLTDSIKSSYDLTWTDKGGYIQGFDEVFNPDGFAVSKNEILKYDPLVHWLLHTGRDALLDAGYYENSKIKKGAVFGNLSFPSHLMQMFSESVWMDFQGHDFLQGRARELAKVFKPDPVNRFMSGLPAHIMARSLNLKAGAFAIDAACASSLYSIKIACDYLQSKKADLMLAGGVNRSDDLLLHIGFCTLYAMSITGQSRPFHKNADGLVPAEGSGFVVLKRLQDAVSDKDDIKGVIRGVGLSNDGKGDGLLVPFSPGQVNALKNAYKMSGLSPEDISLIECHATGTPVGDDIELESMAKVFSGLKDIPIGTIKSNIGHPITASGAAGLIKVLGAMKHGVRPPTLHVEEPNEKIEGSSFRLLVESEPWKCTGIRRAAISNFGFGGNNAHLILEEWTGSSHKKVSVSHNLIDDDIAIVGIGMTVANTSKVQDFVKALFSGKTCLRENQDGVLCGYADPFELPLLGLNFFPAALDQTLPQQLVLLKTAMEAISDAKEIPNDRTGVFAGMGCDTEITRSGLCWRLKHWTRSWMGEHTLDSLSDWIVKTKDHIGSKREAPSVLGAMANIVANRIGSQFDFKCPGYAVSAEELSGIRCLELGVTALLKNEMDAVVVGAVDMSCEPVHIEASKKVLDKKKHIPGDGAAVFVLKRFKDALKDNNKIYAVISDEKITDSTIKFGFNKSEVCLTPRFGHSHAASGLLHVAAAALSCYYQKIPSEDNKKAVPWIVPDELRSAKISINALGGESSSVFLKESGEKKAPAFLMEPLPEIHFYSGLNKKEVLLNLKNSNESKKGPAVLAIIAKGKEEFLKLSKVATHLLLNEKADQFEIVNGIYYCEKPRKGELAFVFTGSAGVYSGMGRELFYAFPEITDEILESVSLLRNRSKGENSKYQSPADMLWQGSFLSQIHGQISRKYFKLAPDAVIGFSSGESNSLFAMSAWRDMGKMAAEFDKMGVFTNKLSGSFDIIKEAWKSRGIDKVSWLNIGLLAPLNEVLSALRHEPLAHLLIINAPGDMVIGGDADACNRIAEKTGRQRSYPVPYHMASHCPELKLYKEQWIKLHKRKTFKVPGVRFYTGSTGSYYYPDEDLAANAIFDMACHTLDFPKMIKNAWNDGVRVFIEHGPGNSCTNWIKKILRDREHLAIPMDRSGKSSTDQLVHVIAQLTCAGIDFDYNLIKEKLFIEDRDNRDGKTRGLYNGAARTYSVHSPKIKFCEFNTTEKTEQKSNINVTALNSDNQQNKDCLIMEPAPFLPPVFMEYLDRPDNKSIDLAAYRKRKNIKPSPSIGKNKKAGTDLESFAVNTRKNISMINLLHTLTEHNKKISSVHQEFLKKQSEIHKRFLEIRKTALNMLSNQAEHVDYFKDNREIQNSEISFLQQPDELFQNNENSFSPETEKQIVQNNIKPKSKPLVNKPAVKKTVDIHEKLTGKKENTNPLYRQFQNAEYLEPCGPSFNKKQLGILASGKISDVFGSMFEIQDDYSRQVRLPEPPLLLADRITGIKAEPGSMGKGVIWTETDVLSDAWYSNDIYMPAGITVESGQCDLTLVSYLGADFKNQGKRVYRLLGCDLMYYGEPPRAGETLCYQIHVDGHANIGDTRIFFFRYDCRISGKLRLSVRNAQAGFFSDKELANSKGILWSPETGEHKPTGEVVMTEPLVLCSRNRFSKKQVKAFSLGKVVECFGEGFEISETHSKTPKLQSGKMLLLDEVTKFDPKGGPWKRGYLRVDNRVPSDAWYLVCHFKNDPCMPGTLMSDACLQTMAFYIAAMGYTLDKDGWRFEPVPDEVISIKCRGQVTPESDHLIYETFIEEFEIVDGLYPTVYADILATCDGRRILHVRRMGLRLVPDWPLDCWPHLLENYKETRTAAKIDNMEFGYKSLLACAFGKPSDAFGPQWKIYDTGRHIARLPGPPYHFMTRISKIDATPYAMKKGEVIEAEYDVPSDAWYFDKNGNNKTMPFCVLMEVALQPCGWLAVFIGGPSESESPLYFRNLDGTGTVLKEVMPDAGIITTRTKIVNIARITGVVLIRFEVECFAKNKMIYKMDTGFGFFTEKDLALQVGLGALKEEIEWLDKQNDFMVDLTKQPEKYYNRALKMPGKMLLMIDRVTGYWKDSGENGFGRMRAEKRVNASEWFFKSHFFHDPVQPGSLGVEAIVQLLQFYMIYEAMDKGIENPRFEPIAIDHSVTWRYRGQVTPDKKRISVEIQVIEKGYDKKGAYVVAEGFLWADNLRIFNVKNLRMNIVSGG